MTYAEVKQAWFKESFDLAMATQEQITRLCDDLGTDDPDARWHDYQEEMHIMCEQAKEEFGF